MGMLAELTVGFGMDLSRLKSDIAGAKQALGGFADAMPGILGPAVIGVAAVGAAAIGIGVASVHAAGDFRQAMLKVKALAAPATEDINKMSDAVLAMAPAVGQGPTKLAAGLYFIESAGLHGKQALDLLQLSAEAASSGGIKDMKIVADAATSAINSYGQANLSSQRAVDVMTATVSAGKMEWSSYASAVANLTAKAAQGKAGFEEANAAMAIFTRTGESAQLSANHLGAMMLFVGTQAEKMAKNASKAGVAFDAQKFSALDLAGKMEYLHTVTNGNFAVAQKLLGGNKTLASTYEKLYDNVGSYNDVLKDLRNSQGATDQKFAQTSAGFNASMEKMKAAMDVLLIKIGTGLLPTLSKIVSNVIPLVLAFADWMGKSNALQNVLDFLGHTVQQLQDAFSAVFFPVQQTAHALHTAHVAVQPIIDTFEQLHVRIGSVTTVVAPFIDSLGRGVGIIHATHVATQPVVDTFERLHVAIGTTVKVVVPLTQSFDHAKTVINPFVDVMKWLKDIVNQLLPPLEKLGLSLAPIIKNIVTWAAQNNVLGDALSIVEHILSLVATVVGDLANGLSSLLDWLSPLISNFLDWADKNKIVQKATDAVNTAIDDLKGFIQDTIDVIAKIVRWYNDWHDAINRTAVAITVFFTPALIKAGVESLVSGTKIAAGFIASVIQTGVEAIISGVKITVNFIASMIEAGTQAWIQGPKVIAGFVSSVITTGVEAVINAAKVTASFIASMVAAGLQAITQGPKIIASFVASMIATGTAAVVNAAKVTASFIASMVAAAVQAVISAATITASFIASIVTTGVQAVITAGKLLLSLVPAIIGVAVEAGIAATTALPGLIAGLYGVASAAGAADIALLGVEWPVLLVVGAILLLIATIIAVIIVIQNWGKIGPWLKQQWQLVLDFFLNFAKAMTGSTTGLIISIIQLFQSLYDALVGHSIVPDMCNAIIGWFARLPGRAVDAIFGLAEKMRNFFNALANDAMQWGSNIVNNIATGMLNALGQVQSAASTVAKAIADHLPQSPAKVGPLRNLVASGTHISEQIAQGMMLGAPIIKQSISQVVYPIRPSAGMVASAAGASSASVQGSGQSHTTIVEIDSMQLAHLIQKRTDEYVRLKIGARGRVA